MIPEPNDTPNTEPAAEAAAAPEPAAPEPTLEEAMVQALDEGVASLEPAEPEPEAAPEAEAAEEPEQPEPPAEPEPDDVEQAVAQAKADGVSEKGQARVRELATKLKELAPVQDVLKKAGIEDINTLPELVNRAKQGDELMKYIQETGADAEQYGLTLDYLATVNKALKGDTKAAEQALAVAQREVQQLAALIGREVPGMHDPLAAHADLNAAVEAGEMTRKYALEVAQARQGANLQRASTERASTEQQQAQALEQARGALQQFDATMASSDPTYAAKRPALNQMVAFIRQNLPPEKWIEATKQAYATIPAPVVAPAPAPPPKAPVGPVRPTGPRPTMAPSFDDPMKALEAGVASVRG